MAQILESPELVSLLYDKRLQYDLAGTCALSLVSHTVRDNLKKSKTYLGLKQPQHREVSADQLAGFPALRILSLHFDSHHNSCSMNSLEDLTRLTEVHLFSYKAPSLQNVISKLPGGLSHLVCRQLQVASLQGLELLTSLRSLRLDVTFIALGELQGTTSYALQAEPCQEPWDSSSKAVAALTGLRELCLRCYNTDPIDPRVLSQLSQLHKLEALEVTDVSVPGQLSACQQLTRLRLTNTFTQPVKVPVGLSGLQQLKWLNLENVDHSSIHGVSNLCNLTSLRLQGPEHMVNTSELWYLSRLPASLQELHIDCRDRLLPSLSHLTQLVSLYVGDSQGLEPLVGLTCLHRLSLNFKTSRDRLPETYLQPITQLQTLAELEMTYANQTLELGHLTGLTRLRALILNWTDVSFGMQSTLLRRLDELALWRCQFDSDTVHAVTALMGQPEILRQDDLLCYRVC